MTGSQVHTLLAWDTLPGYWATCKAVAAALVTLKPLCLQVSRYQRRKWAWEVVLGAVGSKTSHTGDAKDSMEPRPSAVVRQGSGLDTNLQCSHRVFTLLIKLT